MVRPFNKLFTFANSSTNYFANDVTGTSLALVQTATPDGLAHKVTVLNNSGIDHSGKTITIVGTNSDGGTQTETIAGPDAGVAATVTSTYYYKTVTSVTFSSTIAPGTVDVSYSTAFASPTYPLNWRGGLPIIDVIVSGTINYTVQFTNDLVNQGDSSPYSWLSNAGSPLTGATSSQSDVWAGVPVAARLITSSYSNGATAEFQISQKDI